MKNKFLRVTAKIIRIITMPTLLFFIFFLVLALTKPENFPTFKEYLIPILFIGVLPILAYPLSWCIKKEKDQRRDFQRKLAFIFCGVGYALGFIFSLIFKFNDQIMLLVTTYLLSVVVLSAFNLAKQKASGHACGIAGPLVVLVYYFGFIYLIPCVIILALSIWSSLYMKRHTLKEYILGASSSIIAFFISLLLITII